ncbi:UbiH/UbiF family hydroxylase [Cognatishimia activa]|uniref:2-octaprenyl-6-methoxyphenol hydroxylase n=1 Tax=Cognatishimia activa TaxID=1715691 RepID=A0A0P1IUK1_9RHOB|nr:UbiH/UbiF family hydroxylase [Cognatishimia activa]CUI88528.1 2-octaprenyl-6-methoxyphenol hydroxylase [Cognatishimia activa]CUK25644.1 2-octaprenyl-6-methoxyphenol hydroxylase [Cognatishimia activa]
MTQSFDVLVSGGGIAGLTAAAAFGSAGFSVLCVDPTPPVTERDAQGSDLRSTAFLQPARILLQEAGLWARLEEHAAPLQTMRIVDAGGAEPKPRVIKDFDASDISDLPFGWNLPNWLLRREMVAHLQELDNVELRLGVASADLFTRQSEARVSLSDGTKVQCKLVVAADGRASKLREKAGIAVKTTRYGQKALALAVTHPIPHDNVSTEVHRSGGPFTLVPLPDYKGHASSALVWMERSARAQELFEMEETAFNAAMTERSGGLYGPLELASRRTIWPIISQIAERFSGERLALIAETAHVVPPIGAQGLNTSLADLRVLLELSNTGPARIGDAEMLAAYESKRRSDVAVRVKGIDLLNRASMVQTPALRDARALGLQALYGLAPVRKMLMQMGLGVR